MARKTHPRADGKKPRFKKMMFKKKSCRFCADKIDDIDYKNLNMIQSYMTERGKIIAGRVTGSCARHQRQLTLAIKRARDIALMSYSSH